MSCTDCIWKGTLECPYWTEYDDEPCDEFVPVNEVLKRRINDGKD